MRLQMKFKASASDKDRERVLEDITKRTAEAQRLFPEAQDPVRSNMYTIETAGSGDEQLLEVLNRHEAVEFAEGEVRRTLATARPAP